MADVIYALGRELGSGGREIGERVARLVGAQLLDKEIVDLVAARIGAPAHYVEARDEAVEGFVDRLFRVITSASPEAYSEAEVLDWSEERLAELTAAIIREHAFGEPLVVIGRGAPVLLRDRDDVFRVFVTASMETRVERLMRRLGKKRDEALRDCKASDSHRGAYMLHHYKVDWRDARLYDLVVNTDRLDFDDAAQIIVEAGSYCRPRVGA